jgi:tetratricopeptide (TPR) repeat protein
VIGTLILALSVALTPLEAYNQGNKLYAQKDYAGAIQAYEQALEAGPCAAVHYNLGNALFKSGQIGRAILSYRRARYLDPRDPDIAANLDFARSYRVDKVLALPSPFARALDSVLHRLSRRAAAVLAPVCFLLAGVLLSLWIVRRWAVLAIGAALLALVALFGLVTQQVWAGEVAARPAVVVVPEVNALSGPSEEFKQILLVHDGTEVRIREARGDYLLVQLPGGSGGWVRKDAVERVYP